MPEIAIDKDSFPSSRKCNIRGSRQVFIVSSEAHATLPQGREHYLFERGILTSHCGHHSASDGGRNNIHGFNIELMVPNANWSPLKSLNPFAGTIRFSTDFHNSFELHPSRKPFKPPNLRPTVSRQTRQFESLHSYP